MMGTVCSKPVCDADCTATKIYENQYFKHMSDLSQSSVAPWTLKRYDFFAVEWTR